VLRQYEELINADNLFLRSLESVGRGFLLFWNLFKSGSLISSHCLSDSHSRSFFHEVSVDIDLESAVIVKSELRELFEELRKLIVSFWVDI